MILRYSRLQISAEKPADTEAKISEGLAFVQEYWDHKSGMVPVLADVAKVDAAWKLDSSAYVGPGGTENAIRTRYPDFQQWLKEHAQTPIIMPHIGVYKGTLLFGNGRHRFSVLRDMGIKKIWVSVCREDLKEFEKRYK